MKIHIRFAFYSFLLWCLIFIISCNNGAKYITPKNYDLNHPVKIELESQLDEISGINYYAKDTSIFAISDATGSLYKVFPDKKTMVQKWKFAHNQDFEDLQLYDSIFYILSSSGNIVSVKFFSADSLQATEYNFPEKKVEFEALYFDSTTNKLILICKDCKEDKKNYVGTWAFDLASKTYQPGFYNIDYKNINNYLKGGEKSKLKPSAAAINPLTHQLYILASVNKLLVIADKNGTILKVYPLDPSIYKQPEGIAFTNKGDLLISNESAKDGSANILVIKYKKQAD